MKPIRVLIADDVANIRTLVKYWLDPEEFVVVAEAADGAEAVRKARENQPDAVILDLSMPVMDGLQAIPEIRKGSPGTKIVVLSGFDADTLSTEALSLGAHAYLEKGVGFDELSSTISRLCA